MKKFLFFSYFLCKIPIFFPIFWDHEFLFSYFLDPSCYLTPCDYDPFHFLCHRLDVLGMIFGTIIMWLKSYLILHTFASPLNAPITDTKQSQISQSQLVTQGPTAASPRGAGVKGSRKKVRKGRSPSIIPGQGLTLHSSLLIVLIPKMTPKIFTKLFYTPQQLCNISL